MTHLAVRPDRLACRFDEMSPDTPLNRVLEAAVARLSRFTRSLANARRLAGRAARFEFVPHTSDPLREPVRLDRTNTAFHDLFRLARLQDRRNHALSDAHGEPLFSLQPDAVIETSPDDPIVLDTKWKRLTSDKEALGVAESDVYRLLAYGRAYGAARLVLLYPWHRELGDKEGVIRRWTVTDAGDECYLDISTLGVGCPDPVRVAETLRAIVGSFGSVQDLSQAA